MFEEVQKACQTERTGRVIAAVGSGPRAAATKRTSLKRVEVTNTIMDGHLAKMLQAATNFGPLQGVDQAGIVLVPEEIHHLGRALDSVEVKDDQVVGGADCRSGLVHPMWKKWLSHGDRPETP